MLLIHFGPRNWTILPSSLDAVFSSHVMALMSRWRHQMEMVSISLAVCEGKSPVTGGSPHKRASNTGVNVFFDIILKKRLKKRVDGDLRRQDAYCVIIVMVAQLPLTKHYKTVISTIRPLATIGCFVFKIVARYIKYMTTASIMMGGQT